MSWTGSGFVDAHSHLLWVASGEPPPFKFGDKEDIRQYHERLHTAGTTPTDAYYENLPSDLLNRIARELESAASLGIVELHAMSVTQWGYVDALIKLRENNQLPLRVRLFFSSGYADVKKMAKFGDPALEIAGVKFYADGWLTSRTCAVSEPFDDEPHNDGVLFMDSVALARRAAPFAEQGWQIATHAIGDRAVESVLDAYQMIYGEDCASHAPRIEHCSIVSDDLMSRIAAMGVVVCLQPSFAPHDKDDVSRALGSRAVYTYQWKAMYEREIKLLSGSDYPIESQDPLMGLRDLTDGDSLTLAQALEIMTHKDAGTVTLSDDPYSADLSALKVVGTHPVFLE